MGQWGRGNGGGWAGQVKKGERMSDFQLFVCLFFQAEQHKLLSTSHIAKIFRYLNINTARKKYKLEAEGDRVGETQLPYPPLSPPPPSIP